jgi:hypothetical protein
MTYQPNNVEGPFLQGSDFFSLNETDLRTRLTTMYSKTANSVNAKEIAIYVQNEIVTGQQFYNLTDFQQPRIGFRKVFPIDASMVVAGTITLAHGIQGIIQCTAIKGCALFDNGDWRPIPYASASNVTHQVSVHIDNTDIIIHIGVGSPNLVSGHITLEYLKN